MEDIRRVISAFLDRTGMPPTRLGRAVMKDPRVIGDMLNGRGFRPQTEVKLRA